MKEWIRMRWGGDFCPAVSGLILYNGGSTQKSNKEFDAFFMWLLALQRVHCGGLMNGLTWPDWWKDLLRHRHIQAHTSNSMVLP